MTGEETSKHPTRTAVHAAIDSHASNSGRRAQADTRTVHHTYNHHTIVSTHHIPTQARPAALSTRSHSSYHSTPLAQRCFDNSSDDGGTDPSLSSHHTIDVLVHCYRGSTGEQVQSQLHTLSTLSTAQPTVSIIRNLEAFARSRLCLAACADVFLSLSLCCVLCWRLCCTRRSQPRLCTVHLALRPSHSFSRHTSSKLLS